MTKNMKAYSGISGCSLYPFGRTAYIPRHSAQRWETCQVETGQQHSAPAAVNRVDLGSNVTLHVCHGRRRWDQKHEGLHPQAESFFLMGHPSSHTLPGD